MDTIPIENVNVTEFEFEGFSLQWVVNRWEISFQDDEGEQSILFDEKYFENGSFKFTSDGEDKELLETDFNKVVAFCKENRLF